MAVSVAILYTSGCWLGATGPRFRHV